LNISSPRLITCILPLGKAAPVVEALNDERGVTRATIHKARGIGRYAALSGKALAQPCEKDILNVVSEADEADALFTWLYDLTEIAEPHGGIMFMQRLEDALPFALPDLPEEPD